jgi:hypothetical protein
LTENKLAVVDLSKLSEPVSKLIEAVGAAIGAVYEPTRIRRRASAEADAALILAQTDIKIQGLQRRAAERLIVRELRRQDNIEQITVKAIDELPSHVADEKADTDWILQFFDNCQDVSSDELQQIWARILAGEIAQPGSYSPRTLAVLKLMRIEDAKLIERACSFVWRRDDDLVPVILNKDGPFVADEVPTLEFGELAHLQAIGVVTFGGIGEIQLTRVNRMSYFGRDHHLIAPFDRVELPVGRALFTDVGTELAAIVEAKPDEIYRNCVVDYWRRVGIRVDD